MAKTWQTSQRVFDYDDKTLVMAILNVTPDSFSDGGQFETVEKALIQSEKYIEEGADILDIGGESTRPKGVIIEIEEEIQRVIPVIKEIKKRFDRAISIDTSKSEVAEKAVEAGAEIINDISGLRFDKRIGEVSAKYKTGLILMHLRGEFETMHRQEETIDISQEVSRGFNWSIETAKNAGVKDEKICLDVGIGFSKTKKQNLELIGNLQTLCDEFQEYPMLIGVSRKSFVGEILGGVSTAERLNGTIAANVISVWNGANIVRVHDVKPAVEAIKVINAIAKSRL